ncbi:hypothetical protein L202_07226 [Cryptococcus amylolentus CBS 6039]|uniref:Uncharacterized protein n=1 Tax=Cryptococcus amylolentus CBS 6039 TaxID=1295533 RepID=A0A1E3HBG0_9TREE|nr:hypothetical protein L202_07226 [Cryptococcus amylolentus CBS 6039]ODN73679.1 hypothetical protein L202_07226 [Cryptococcus amylolentus CBS 6039]
MLFNAPALFTTTLLALTASTSPVSAIDYRLLANKPGSGSIESFKISFKTQCPFFNPTNNTDANHRSTFFVPGDWQGQNTDSKALVYCVRSTHPLIPPRSLLPSISHTDIHAR